MLHTFQKFENFFNALPEKVQLAFRLGTHKRLETFLTQSGTFYDFINHGLTWDNQPEGRRYWESMASASTLQEIEACEKYRNRNLGDLVDQMNEKRKAIFLHNLGKTRDSSYFLRSGNLRELINQITWDATDVPRKYWEQISENNNNEFTRSAEDYWTTCENINGEEIPRYKLDLLSKLAYGKDIFAKNEKYEMAYVYDYEGQCARVLAKDCIFVWVNREYKQPYFKKDFEKWGFIEFGGEYYRNETALAYHGIFKIKGEGWQKLDRTKHCETGGFYQTIANLDPVYVYVNAENQYGVRVYDKHTSSYTFKCAYSGLYFNENYENKHVLVYVDDAGNREDLIFSTKALPSYSGRKNFRDQIIEPYKLEINLSGATLRFLSDKSARNFGLVCHICPHCNEFVSQYHNTEACKRQNFKNVRYDYHSHKPKRVNTSAEYKIGVEIEKESFDGACHPAPAIFKRFGWVKERDGSLDGMIGYELVSPCYPLFTDKLTKEAEEIEQEFPQLINGEISGQCGGHIHFSKRGVNGSNLLQAHCGYLPLLYAIYKNRTTKSYSHAKEKEEMKQSSDKYQAVRILSDRIEFRIFPAVKNLDSLKWRIKLLRYMAKNPTDNPLKVVNDLCDKRTALHKLFLEIFAEQTIYKRALDTLLMAQKYDRNFYNIDFSKQAKGIQAKAKKSAKKK